jgi:hypothetical protein
VGFQLRLVDDGDDLKSRYSIDSSVLLDIWKGDQGLYPKEVYVGLWAHIDQLVQEGRIFMHGEVYKEIKDHPNAEFQKWLAKNKDTVVVNKKEAATAAKEIINNFYSKFKNGYMPSKKGGNAADPFVVGLAYAEGCFVFTQEKPIPAAQLYDAAEPHIPNICIEHKVRFVSINQFLTREGIVLTGSTLETTPEHTAQQIAT